MIYLIFIIYFLASISLLIFIHKFELHIQELERKSNGKL